MWSKETSLVMLVFAPAAVAASALVRREKLRLTSRDSRLLRYALLLSSVIAGILLSKVPYLLFPKQGNSSAYVDYSIDGKLVLENLATYAAQQPDVLLFGLASLWLLGVVAMRMRAAPERFSETARVELAFVSGLLGIAWGYYGGLLIWRWAMGYYMLLPSILFKLTAIYGFMAARRAGLLRTGATRACVSLAVVGILYALAHGFYVATAQASFSRMYTQAISRYVQAASPSNRLVFESYPFYSEEVTNTQQLIEILYGQKRATAGIGDIVDPATINADIAKLLKITQARLDANEASLPRAGDYLLVMTGNKIATWFVRGVCPMFSDDSVLLKQDAYDMIPVAEDKLFVPGAFLNVWTYRPSIARTYVGYKLYRVTSDMPRLIWRGRYPDGWTTRSASVRLFPRFGKHARVTLSTPDFNSPNRVTITQDGQLVRRLTLVAGKVVTLDLDNPGPKPTRIEFAVGKTVAPKKIKVNEDTRELGIMVDVRPPKDDQQ
jgi:hypothetical protein